METVQDGRILQFVRDLPNGTKTKVLLTSRQKNRGGWELPIPVEELKGHEIYEFIQIKSKEENVDFPLDEEICNRIADISGGASPSSQVDYRPVQNQAQRSNDSRVS